ncbi:hypothetical protein C9374_012523 [Naegleria lovaniensis]|uniref:YEATS domain-containing protein n=1 Tax=Naegleria lovaniensis TaxID=51637 RepID=A0AA88KQA0_NAELO|nr:uncharacterized protein C9374_012523 [Naegleria lovaniensis]KAG2392271.1 hypothetical protein C9374_012523 [Naegleria lovaniensis]
MDEEDETIDYEENLREKHLEQKLIEERLKEVAHKQELLKKLWSELNADQAMKLASFLENQKKTDTIRKRIVVGNTSHYISEKHREVHDSYTHKWTIYVRGSSEEPDISTYVKKVRVFLHRSFAPNDIVDIYHPPFHVSRRGYGEFQVIVQLHFKGNTDINKPLDIVHHLSLDRKNTGKIVNSAETIADIELDKQALAESDTFVDTHQKKIKKKLTLDSDEEFSSEEVIHLGSASPSKKKKKSPNDTKDETALKIESELIDEDLSFISDMPFPPFSCQPSKMNYMVTRLDSLNKEERAVKLASERFPMIADSNINLPYLFATSDEVFINWTIGKRKCAERKRALEIKRYLQTKQPDFNLSTSYIARLLRKIGLTPIVFHKESVLDMIEEEENKKNLETAEENPQFCKYCGCPHQPQSDFNRIQDRCRKRMKIPSLTYHIESCTTSLDDDFSLPLNECPHCTKFFTSSSMQVNCDCSDVGIDDIMDECDFKLDDKAALMFNVLFRKFASSLITHSMAMYKAQAMNETFKESEGKVLVPFHVMQSIMECPQLDFLRNNLKVVDERNQHNKKRKKP